MRAIRPVLGLEVGTSLAVMQAAAHHSMTPELVIVDLCLAHAVYGRDRLHDQLGDTTDVRVVQTFAASTSLAVLACCYGFQYLSASVLAPIVVVLSVGYKRGKQLLGPAKPFVIGWFWAVAIVQLPPDAVPPSLFPVYWSLYAAVSNLADIKDASEDAQNNIQTVPVAYGTHTALIVTATLAACSIALHHTVPNWSYGDYLIESTSVGALLWCTYTSVFALTSD